MSVQPTGQAPSSTGRTERSGESRSADAGAAFGLALAEAKGAAQRRTTQPVQTRDSRDDPRSATAATPRTRGTAATCATGPGAGPPGRPTSGRTSCAARTSSAPPGARAARTTARAPAERGERTERSERSRAEETGRPERSEGQPVTHPSEQPQVLGPAVGTPVADPAAEGEPPAGEAVTDPAVVGIEGEAGGARAGRSAPARRRDWPA